jgi:hypothetical protein
MKQYFANSAGGRTLAWGVGLMAPAGLFFLVGVLGILHTAQLVKLPLVLPTLPILIAVLPVVAIIINVGALIHAGHRDRLPVLSISFAHRYFWTLATIAVALGWLGLLFGHDTVGCAVHYLPMLQWQTFQHCAATH